MLLEDSDGDDDRNDFVNSDKSVQRSTAPCIGER